MFRCGAAQDDPSLDEEPVECKWSPSRPDLAQRVGAGLGDPTAGSQQDQEPSHETAETLEATEPNKVRLRIEATFCLPAAQAADIMQKHLEKTGGHGAVNVVVLDA